MHGVAQIGLWNFRSTRMQNPVQVKYNLKPCSFCFTLDETPLPRSASVSPDNAESWQDVVWRCDLDLLIGLYMHLVDISVR